MLTRSEAVAFLKSEPVKYARLLGFSKLTDLHKEWMTEMLLGKTDLTIMAHRSSYKTTCVSVVLALIAILMPSKRTLFIRKTDDDVKEVIRQVQKILTDPHTQYFVNSIYNINLTLPVQSATELNTNIISDIKGANQLRGLGIGSSLTGKHYDFIFTDDISNLNDRTSKAERDRTKLTYQELQNIKNCGGRIINTLTPWHPEDVSTLMPEARKYDCYSTGLMSKEEIEDIKTKMTRSLFAANYELRHIASEDVIFTDPVTGYDPSILDQAKNCHIDAAYGGEDYTAFTIIKKTGGKFYVFGKLYHKAVDDVLDDIIQIRQGFNAGRIYCEDNADKGYLAKELTRRHERVITYHEGMNKFLKITSYLKAEWQNVIFVAGTDEEYIRQICDYNENAEHDDAPDSLASLVRQLWYVKESDRKAVNLW